MLDQFKGNVTSRGSSIRWKVVLTFVHPDLSSGYQKEYWSNADNRDSAIVEALSKHTGEDAPFAGVEVYECVFVM